MESAGMKKVHRKKSLISPQHVSDTTSLSSISSSIPKLKTFYRKINMALLPPKGQQAVRVLLKNMAHARMRLSIANFFLKFDLMTIKYLKKKP